MDLESTKESGNTLSLSVEMPSSNEGSFPEGMRRVSLTESEGTKDLKAQWQEDDEVLVIIRQDDKVYNIGKVKISEITMDGKHAVLNMDLPGMLYQNKPYTMYCFTGINGSVQDNGDGTWFPYCRMEIQRSLMTQFRAPMFSQVKVNPMSSPSAFFKHIGTYELLHFKNTSTKSISAVHCGFDVDKPWYQGETGVVLTDSYDHTQLSSEWEGDSDSPSLTIPAGTERVIISNYMPSGFKIQNAELVMRIDGKVVKSKNTKSSNVTIQRGHAYHMYAEWDGTQLRFVDGSSNDPLQLSTTSLTLTPGQQVTVEVTSGSGNYGAVCEPASVATVSVEGSKLIVKAVGPGNATIIVKDNVTLERAEIKVTVNNTPQAYLTCPDDHHPHLIDLGLPSGTKWACCNVDDDHSKQSPTHYGSYYAWGEVKGKTYYDWSNYVHCNGTYDTCHDLGNDIAGTQNDVAHYQWGGSWVMPTKQQQDELRNKCTYKWTSVNGVIGGLFTGPNGGTIFLPASGSRWGNDLTNAGSFGYYWSSMSNPSMPDGALELSFGSGYVYWSNDYRYGGQSVRPVSK